MSGGLRILVTGFGPFPGASFNPTMPLVRRLTELRRPALGGVELIGHIFHVTYATSIAGEAMLLELVKLTRQALRASWRGLSEASRPFLHTPREQQLSWRARREARLGPANGP